MDIQVLNPLCPLSFFLLSFFLSLLTRMHQSKHKDLSFSPKTIFGCFCLRSLRERKQNSLKKHQIVCFFFWFFYFSFLINKATVFSLFFFFFFCFLVRKRKNIKKRKKFLKKKMKRKEKSLMLEDLVTRTSRSHTFDSHLVLFFYPPHPNPNLVFLFLVPPYLNNRTLFFSFPSGKPSAKDLKNGKEKRKKKAW